MALVKIDIANLQGELVTYYENDTYEVFATFDLNGHHAYFITDGYENRLLVPYDELDAPYAWLDAYVRLVAPVILTAHGLPQGQPNPNELM